MKLFASSLLLMLTPAWALAAMPSTTLSAPEANRLLSGLGVQVKEVYDAPISGMWELVMERSGERSVAYLDHEKKHLFPGPIFDLTSKSLVGAQVPRPQPQPQPSRVDAASIPVADAILMGNPQGKKRLFVFTDPDCPFCASLHRELVRLTTMEPDLAIYVKMFPLKMHPKAFDKARVILGSRSLKLLDQAFSGEELPPPGPNDTAEAVEESIRLADALGISSTPTMVLPDGRVVPGVKGALAIKMLLTIDAM